ncbi:MAG: hypothetical protein ACRD8A_17175 [Candidatus Acidiferrales bacterium]
MPSPVPYANLTNPQTLNLYAIVSDNPETFADLTGHAPALPPPGNPPVAGLPSPMGGGTCKLDGISVACSFISYFGKAVENPDDAAAEQAAQNQANRQQAAQPEQQQNSATPLKDKNGNVARGASGQPALIPSGFDVNAVVKTGKSDAKSLVHKAEDLANFRRGGKWDLQRLSGKFDPRFVDSATILIGMCAASAGITREHILTIENDVAIGGHYAKGTPMDSTYTHLPVRNVTNTDIGMRLVLSGAIP